MTPEKPASRPRIYLAGPDVFFPNRDAIFKDLKSNCEHAGLIGIAPIDAPIQPGADDEEQLAQAIYDGNIALLREADGCIANLRDFRGLEPDSGTVFEAGFAVALGKPVVAYGVPAGTYAERVAAAFTCERDAEGILREEADGTVVEGLGQRLNLMLTRSMHLAPDARTAIAWMARLLRAGQ